MASSINADNGVISGSSGLKSTADASGVLALQSNGTTGLTLNTSLAVGVGSSPSYGTSGQVLTSGGSGAAPSWSTLTVSGSGGTTASGNVTLTSASSGAQSIATTTYGQIVTLPDATTMTKAACVFNISNTGSYPLKIQNSAGTTKGFVDAGQAATIGLADNSTAAGTWVFSNTMPLAITGVTSFASTQAVGQNTVIIQLDSSRDMYVYPQPSFVRAIIFNSATQTWGTPTQVRTGTSVNSYFAAIKTATDQVLVASCTSTTAFEAVVLTVSGTTITVGTAATATLSNSISQLTNSTGANSSAANYLSFIQIGSSFVLSYQVATAGIQLRAMTISGTTVTIGSATTLVTSSATAYLFSVSSSVVLAIYGGSGTTTMYATPYTISGTTITAGTGATIASTQGEVLFATTLGSRWAFTYQLTGNAQYAGAIVSVSGTTATISTANITSATTPTQPAFCTTGTRVLMAHRNGSLPGASYLNAFADNAGTISVGTTLTWTGGGTVGNLMIIPTSATSAIYALQYAGALNFIYSVDATSVTLTYALRQVSQAPASVYTATGIGAAYLPAGNAKVLFIGGNNALCADTQFIEMLGGKFPFSQSVGGAGFQFVKPPIVKLDAQAIYPTGSYMVAFNSATGGDSVNVNITVIEAAQ